MKKNRKMYYKYITYAAYLQIKEGWGKVNFF